MTFTKQLIIVVVLGWLVLGFVIQWYLIEFTSNDYIGNWLTYLLGFLACLIINSDKWQDKGSEK